MTTAHATDSPPIQLPVGADPDISDWCDHPESGAANYRCVWTPSMTGDVRGVVIQYGDGTIATKGDDAPLVYIGGDDYRPDEARAIAAAICRVADRVEAWAGRTEAVTR
jgi:hypothetical protein